MPCKPIRVHFTSGRYVACGVTTKIKRIQPLKRTVRADNLRQGDKVWCLCVETVSWIERNPS